MENKLLIQFQSYLESNYKDVEFIGNNEYIYKADDYYHLFEYEDNTYNLYGKQSLIDKWNYIETLNEIEIN